MQTNFLPPPTAAISPSEDARWLAIDLEANRNKAEKAMARESRRAIELERQNEPWKFK